MDFSFSDEQQLLQDSVRRYLAAQYGFEQRKKILASAAGYSRTVWTEFAGLGLLGLNVPADQDGLAGRAVETLLVSSAMGEALAVEPLLASAVIATRAVVSLAGAARRQLLLEPMMAGDLIAVLVSEAAPPNERAPAVRASPVADGWRLSGRVPAVYHAPVANLLLVPVVTGAQGERYDAVFAIKPQTAGVTMKAYRSVDAQAVADVSFDGVMVDAALRVDEARGSSAGADVDSALAQVHDFGIMALCADALGALDKALAVTVEYTRTRQQFGVPIASFQALQHRMVDMLTRIEQARSLVYLAASQCDGGDRAGRESAVSAAKVLVAEAARFVGQQAVQLHGGMGVADESSISHYFKRLLAAEIRFGSADAHVRRFASQALGA